MSVKASWFQIGLSGTDNLNFHWRNLLDGVLRLTRGSAGTPITDVMTVNADNSVSFPGNVASGVLGAGQTWQNVTASRAASTTYTNTTGRPIYVYISYITPAGGIESVRVDGIVVGRGSGSAGVSNNHYLVVPNGSTYVLTTNGASVSTWAELR